MRTAILKAKIIRQFLQLAQPLSVIYANDKQVQKATAVVAYQQTGTSSFIRGLGNKIVSDVTAYTVTVQTITARESMIYSELIKLASERTGIIFVSEARGRIEGSNAKFINTIILHLHNDISLPDTYSKAQAAQLIHGLAQTYSTVASSFNSTVALTAPHIADGAFTHEQVLQIKADYIDRIFIQSVLTETEPRTRVQSNELLKMFLEMATPLPVFYGYSRGVQKEHTAIITYQDLNSTTMRGIGNQLTGERLTFMVTVQTATAAQNILYTELIKLASDGTAIEFVSDEIRPDIKAKGRWINSIIVHIYNSIHAVKALYSSNDIRSIIQQVVDRYVFITSSYGTTLDTSFIDRMLVGLPEDKLYTHEEMLAIKKEYVDRLILKDVKF